MKQRVGDQRLDLGQRLAAGFRGDEELFRRLFDRFAGPIQAFILAMVGHRDLAEDLTQETFVRAYQRLAGLRDPSKLSSWLFSIARNVSLEALRARRREGVRIDADVAPETPDPRVCLERGLMRRELERAVASALRALDDDKRAVFSLRVFHECSYAEIAEITGFSPAKVKSDLHRARVELRRRLAPYMELDDEL